jgi:hypothetical protein
MPLLLVISFGRDSETAASTLLLLGLSALVGGVLFVGREWLTAFPAVELRLFRSPTFCLLCCSGFFNSMGLFGALFMVPIFMQQVLGLTPLQAGLLLLPAIPFSGLSGLISGRLCDRFSPPLVAIAGLLSMMLIFQAFTAVTPYTTITALVVYLILYRLFMDTVGIPITTLTMHTLPADAVRMGQGLLGVLRSIGASFGVTVTSVFFERRRTQHQFHAYSQYDYASPEHVDTVQDLRLSLHHAGIPETARDQEALDTIRQQMDLEAVALAFQESFLLIGVCFLVAIVPMLCLFSRRLRATAAV